MKDVLELVHARLLLSLVFIGPVLLLLLMGNIRVKQSELHIAVCCIKATDGAAEYPASPVERLQTALAELSNVTVTHWTEPDQNLLRRMQQEKIDLLAIWGKEWRFYTPHTHAYELRDVYSAATDLAISIERGERVNVLVGKLNDAISLIDRETSVEAQDGDGVAPAPGPPEEYERARENEAWATVRDLLNELKGDAQQSVLPPVSLVSASLVNSTRLYFSPSGERDLSAVPGFIALVALFTPFLFASGAIVRERESGTLGAVLLAADSNLPKLIAAKLMLPVLVGLVTLSLMLVASRTAFSLGVKPGLLAALGLQLLAMASAGFIGLTVSMLVRSQLHAYIASATYLLCLILATGFVYPLQQAAGLVRAFSYAFPLTFSGPMLRGWMTQGSGPWLYPVEFIWLVVHLGAAYVISTLISKKFAETL